MIRVGMIGTNWISEHFVNAARLVEGVELRAVYSRKEETGRVFADKHGISHIYDRLEAFTADAELDAVYIASPNAYHADQAIACMDAGKHVLCEKPIASNARELGRMIDAAKRNGVALMEAMKPTLMPNFAAVRDNLHRIGRVRKYMASYCQYSSRYDRYKQGELPNAFNPVFSNGALMDLGIYCLYPAVALFGKPDGVLASSVLLESGADGEGSIILKYGDMDGVVLYSKISESYAGAEIQGELGTMRIDRISTPGRVEIRFRDGSALDISREQNEETMSYEIAEFAALIGAGRQESAINSWAVSMQAMEVMDEARRQSGLVFPADNVQ